MDWLGIVVSSLGGAVAAMFGAWLLFRGRKVDQAIAERTAESEDAKTETTATSEFLKGQQAFQSYVDSIVEKRVDEAVAELKEQVNSLRADMKTMRTESKELVAAVQSRETQLWMWNIRGRIGPMPEFPPPILEKLNITHLAGLGDIEDTQPSPPKETS